MAVLVSTLWLSGCHDRCEPQDQYDPLEMAISSNRYHVFTAAPIVVIGMVTNTRLVDGPRPARRQPQLLVQLTEVGIHIENILRGKIEPADTHFYFFGVSDQNSGYSGPPRYRVAVGERRIFFLTRDGGQLRSMGDVLDYTLLVTTGPHPELRLADKQPLGDLISEVLLSPNPGYDSVALQHALRQYCSVSDHFNSRCKTVFLLRKLMDFGDPDLRVAACLYLAENYAGQYSCLLELRSNPGLSPEIRARVDQDWTARRRGNAALKSALKHFPLQAFASIPFPDSMYAIRDELRLLLDDPDPEIRAISCRVLKQHYPEPESRCLEAIER